MTVTYRTEADALEARRLVDKARARVRASLLDNVAIASPCAASWDDMVGDDQVRHCGACDKDVFNLTHMTREDAERVIVAAQGKLCARYFRRADGTILTSNCTVGARAARRRRLVVAGTTLMIVAAGVLGYDRTRAAQPDSEAPALTAFATASEQLATSTRDQASEDDAPLAPPELPGLTAVALPPQQWVAGGLSLPVTNIVPPSPPAKR